MTKTTVNTQYKLLSSLTEGDVFEHGALFRLPSSERLAWRCEEVAKITTETGERLRCTLHVYYRGIMLRSCVAVLDPATKSVEWRSHVE